MQLAFARSLPANLVLVALPSVSFTSQRFIRLFDEDCKHRSLTELLAPTTSLFVHLANSDKV